MFVVCYNCIVTTSATASVGRRQSSYITIFVWCVLKPRLCLNKVIFLRHPPSEKFIKLSAPTTDTEFYERVFEQTLPSQVSFIF